MKRFFRIGAAAVAAALMFGSVSCSNAFFAKKEGDGLLEQIKYEGTLGGSGTKADPYIVKGGYTIKMPEPIDKKDYKICVREVRKGGAKVSGGSNNYDETECKEVAAPFLEDYTFEARWGVVTRDGNQEYYNDEEWPSKTFYFKVPHLTNEKDEYYEFTADGKKLVCVTRDANNTKKSAIKLTFDVTPEEDGEDSSGNPTSYCSFSLNSVEWRSRETWADEWSEWEKMADETFVGMPDFIKKPTKFTYKSGYKWVASDNGIHGYEDPNQFQFTNNYVWDDDKTLAENLTFCSLGTTIDGTRYDLYILGNMLLIEGGAKSLLGELTSDKTSFTGELGSDDDDDDETATSSVSGKLVTDDYGEKSLELRMDGKDYTCYINPASINYLEEIFSKYLN